ncbi:hypothetical protein NUW58_g5842 [Xylaria curta]|uniref:Uncharacterized protein n=1 Tax=Xylaria curta TaxID=42375 RepID=A0ACC1P161_9PEZI|nr:hypothetical protein NUW58_g5842 [Xylaria curta]
MAIAVHVSRTSRRLVRHEAWSRSTTIIAAVVHNGPVAELAYVAFIAVCDLDDGPRVDMIIYRDAIAPAAETYRLPRIDIYILVDDKTVEPRRGQALVAACGQSYAGQAVANEELANRSGVIT